MGRVYEAMGLGALDAVDTPELGPTGNLDGARLLLDKIATIAKLIGLAPKPSLSSERPPPPKASKTEASPRGPWW